MNQSELKFHADSVSRKIDNALEDKEYFVADTYTIVDIAIFPWVGRHDWQTINLNDYPNVAEWYVNLTKRPAVQRGWKVPENDQQLPMP